MNLKTLKISELKPAEYNPRTITEEALNGLKTSIETFGYIQPIIWNRRTGNVVGGHQRLKVLQSQGQEEVEVIEVDLEPVREKALNVALNNEKIQGMWDYEKLELVLEEVRLEVLEFQDLRLEALQDTLPFEKEIPSDNEPIDEKEMEKTENECPKCFFKW